MSLDQQPIPVKEKSNFRLQSKRFFLTYPQVNPNSTKEQLLAYLTDVFNTIHNPIKFYCIGKEAHKDGGIHYHIVIELTKGPYIRQVRFFDWENHHPNISAPIRNLYNTIQYCKKDGDYDSTFPSINSNKEDKWEIVVQAETPSQFWQILKENFPKDFVKDNEKLEYFCNKYLKPAPTQFRSQFTVFPYLPEPIINWKSSNIGQTRGTRCKSLLVCGKTRSGKTEWARSVGKHIYMQGRFNLKLYLEQWNNEIDYIIFDDIHWPSMVYWKQWVSCQTHPFQVHDRYTRTTEVHPNGIPLIILCNDDNNPLNHYTGNEYTYFINNIIYVVLSTSLYETIQPTTPTYASHSNECQCMTCYNK